MIKCDYIHIYVWLHFTQLGFWTKFHSCKALFIGFFISKHRSIQWKFAPWTWGMILGAQYDYDDFLWLQLTNKPKNSSEPNSPVTPLTGGVLYAAWGCSWNPNHWRLLIQLLIPTTKLPVYLEKTKITPDSIYGSPGHSCRFWWVLWPTEHFFKHHTEQQAIWGMLAPLGYLPGNLAHPGERKIIDSNVPWKNIPDMLVSRRVIFIFITTPEVIHINSSANPSCQATCSANSDLTHPWHHVDRSCPSVIPMFHVCQRLDSGCSWNTSLSGKFSSPCLLTFDLQSLPNLTTLFHHTSPPKCLKCHSPFPRVHHVILHPSAQSPRQRGRSLPCLALHWQQPCHQPRSTFSHGVEFCSILLTHLD